MSEILNYLNLDRFKNELGDLNFLGKTIKVLIIFLVVYILKRLISRFIYRTFERRRHTIPQIDNRRMETLVNILSKIVTTFISLSGVLMALEVFGIDTKALIGAMGVGGIAVGFGAQSLVKDLITGFFILMEDQYSVGDHVNIEGKDGLVEDLGLRVTKIRDFSGELHIIPNSYITMVTNKTRGPMRATVIVSIAYEEDVEHAIKVLEKMCRDIWQENENILEEPLVMGVVSASEYSIDIQINTQAKAVTQWGVERYIRQKALETLKRENIEIPYPKNVIYRGDE